MSDGDVARRETRAEADSPSLAGMAVREPRLARILLNGLLGVLAAVGAVGFCMTALTDFAGRLGIYDFSFYYDCALTLLQNPHANIYDQRVVQAVADTHHIFLGKGAFQYPPLLPILVMPLTKLSFAAATRVWLELNLVLWLLGAALLAGWLRRGLLGREAPLLARAAGSAAPRRLGGWLVATWQRTSDETRFAIGVAIFAALTYAPLAQAMWLGQVSPLIFVLVLLAPWLLRRGQPELAGGALALATMIKVLPGLLIVYFVFRRQWRVLLGAVVGIVVLTVAMVPVIGVAGVLNALQILSNGTTDAMRYQNESLSRLPMWIAIWFGHHQSTSTLLPGYALIALVALAFLAGLVWRPRGRHATGGAAGGQAKSTSAITEDLLGYNWALCTMVLVSPITWEHHDAWLLPAIVFCLAYAVRRLASGVVGADGRLRPEVWVLVALAVGYALTRNDLPFGYDTNSNPALDILFLNHPVRPIFMVMRPIGGLLIWGAAGWLFWRSRMGSGEPSAPGDADADADADESRQEMALPVRADAGIHG